MYKLNAHKKYSIWWMWPLVIGIASACLLSNSMTAHAYGLTDCAGARYGAYVNCNANDVQITNIAVVGGPSSCIGGESITLDLDLTVNFGQPQRYDTGIFISNDGKNPQYPPAENGATSCSVAVLPLTSPFQNLDGDGCGDGSGNLIGLLRMTSVTINCKAISGSLGNLHIPFLVSWDNQASPSGDTCTSAADPMPSAPSKCNAPTVAQGTVSVVVMPSITITDGISIITPGDTVNYTVVITNTTGDTLSGAVFKDPAVTYLTANSVTCTAGGGATCPASPTVGAMQGAGGITIPSMPANGSVTFTINATLDINAPAGELLTNMATATVGGQTNSASDTDTISSIPVGVISISPSSSSKNSISPASVVYNYTIYNRASSPPTDTITLSATSSQGWPFLLSTSSLTVNANGSATFTLTVLVPSDITVGTLDTTTITAISTNNPSNTATATAITTVSNPITITPNNIASGGKGSSAYYDHTVQNNTSITQIVTLTIDSMSGSYTGWTAAIYKSDRVTSIASVTLDPYGSFGDLDKDIVVKVNIPASAATGSICTVTVKAEAGNSATATDETTVKGLVLYSDSNYIDENNIFPVGHTVYAKAFGLDTTANKKYYFEWHDDSCTSITPPPKRTSPANNPDANKQLPDSYSIPTSGVNLGTWCVRVCLEGGSCPYTADHQVNFYVGPDHISAGSNLYAPVNTNVTITLSLHDYNIDPDLHVVPKDPSGNVVQGGQCITVTISGSATIVSTTLNLTPDASCTNAGISGQTIIGRLDSTTGKATITITADHKGTVTVTPNSSTLVGSKAGRDEPITVIFVRMKMRVLKWREVQ